LILEEQIQLVLTRVRDKVSRSSIYTAKILLETPMLRYYWKLQCWKVNYIAKILLETPMLESWLHLPIKESFALSLLLSRPWQLMRIENDSVTTHLAMECFWLQSLKWLKTFHYQSCGNWNFFGHRTSLYLGRPINGGLISTINLAMEFGPT
jgi:hypothetical protein